MGNASHPSSIFRADPIGRRGLVRGFLSVGLGLSAMSRLVSPVLATSDAQVRWVSPRGSLDVLDDYPYWVAKKFGYFGEIETVAEAGPTSGQGKLVSTDKSDVCDSPPDIFATNLSAGLPLVSVFQMYANDILDFALPRGSKIKRIEQLAGKTILLGEASWKSFVDLEFAQNGISPKRIKYVDAGLDWPDKLEQGKGDAALCWEGLRAVWASAGYDFDYLLGADFSKFPGNSFQIRRSDFEDSGLADLYTRYLAGWASGLEFGHLNPRAATEITMEARPKIREAFDDVSVAVDSLVQLARIYRGNFAARGGWGWHDASSWQLYFDAMKSGGQLSEPLRSEAVITNEYIAGANQFDRSKVNADAKGYRLSDEFAKLPSPAVEP